MATVAGGNRSVSGVAIWALVGVFSLAATVLGRWMLERSGGEPGFDAREVFLLPPADTLRVMDLGHHEVFADLLFIRANLYYGEHILTDERLPWLRDYVSTIIRLDPDFRQTYLWGAMVLLYQSREVSYLPPEQIDQANGILRRGLERFPGDYRFPMRIGYNLYYEMGAADEAIPYFERASRMPGAPSWLAVKILDLHTKKGRYAMAARMLEDQMSRIEDPELIRMLEERMKVVLDDSRREHVKRFWEELVARWHRHYDYCSFDFFLLVDVL